MFHLDNVSPIAWPEKYPLGGQEWPYPTVKEKESVLNLVRSRYLETLCLPESFAPMSSLLETLYDCGTHASSIAQPHSEPVNLKIATPSAVDAQMAFLESPSTLPSSSPLPHAPPTYLTTLLVTMDKIAFKYRKILPPLLSALILDLGPFKGDEDDEEDKKFPIPQDEWDAMRVGLAIWIKKSQNDYDINIPTETVVESSKRPPKELLQAAKSYIEHLEKREVLLQILILLLIPHQPPAAQYSSWVVAESSTDIPSQLVTSPKKRKKDKKERKSSKKAGSAKGGRQDEPVEESLEQLTDRLSVWQALGGLGVLGNESDEPSILEQKGAKGGTKNNGVPDDDDTRDWVQIFCQDVVEEHFIETHFSFCSAFHSKVFSTTLEPTPAGKSSSSTKQTLPTDSPMTAWPPQKRPKKALVTKPRYPLSTSIQEPSSGLALKAMLLQPTSRSASPSNSPANSATGKSPNTITGSGSKSASAFKSSNSGSMTTIAAGTGTSTTAPQGFRRHVSSSNVASVSSKSLFKNREVGMARKSLSTNSSSGSSVKDKLLSAGGVAIGAGSRRKSGFSRSVSTSAMPPPALAAPIRKLSTGSLGGGSSSTSNNHSQTQTLVSATPARPAPKKPIFGMMIDSTPKRPSPTKLFVAETPASNFTARSRESDDFPEFLSETPAKGR